MKTRNKIIIALGLVYLIGVGFFSFFTYPNTHINNHKKGLVSKDSALNINAENPSLTIKGRNDKSEILSGNAIDYKQILVPGQSLKQNQFLWPIEVFKKHRHEPEYDVSFNKEKIDNFLVGSSLMQEMQEPKDARLIEAGDKFEIQEEEPGDTIDKVKAVESIVNALKNGETELVLDDEYIEPKLTSKSEELQKRLENANSVATLKIALDMGDDVVELSPNELLDFYIIDNNEFVPMQEHVYEYVRQLAIEYDTFSPETEREFTTTGGSDIVVVGGIYGWQIDVDETSEQLYQALLNKKDETIIPTYLQEGLTRGKDDLKDTYIEISIDQQHLWFYKDGELITETDVVTGDPTRGVATHTGVGKIWSKEKDRNLVGIVPEGSSDYSSYVDFWMPINWDNEGIHNSKWRTTFGGGTYVGNGSYGCVNLPYDPTSIIFEKAELNTPVVVY